MVDAVKPNQMAHPIRTLSSNSSSNEQQQQQQLFLCFTTRLSSSSSSSTMKITKSILSPGRSAREISLSRRLKTNGSLKGGQSPMFPTTTTTSRKKTGAGFENPEPSSPKVTCIGQVRVKSKKKKNANHNSHTHVINNRSRSQRRSADYSFRRIDVAEDGLKRESSTSYRNREIELQSSHRHFQSNQKWTICESLRSFGSDFNCFRSTSCMSDKEQREAEKNGCGSVLARWLVAVQDGEGGEKGGGRQIELVVGGRDDEICGRRSYRKRHVMEDIDIKEIEKDLKERVGGRDEIVEGGRRLSICVPPKNALLLMRCGSDPVKMAALANRFWEPPEKDEEDEEKDVREVVEQCMVLVKDEDVSGAFKEREMEQEEIVFESALDEQANCDLAVLDEEELLSSEIEMPEMKDEDEDLCDKFVTEEMYEDVLEELGIADTEQAIPGAEHGDMEISIERQIVIEDTNNKESIKEEEMRDDMVVEETETDHLVTSPISEQEEDRYDVILMEQSKSDSAEVDYAKDESDEDNSDEVKQETATCTTDKVKESSVLPDCLLLMMCEPKLSMEVSQETWVCTTDFIRWLPPREPNNATTKKKNDKNGAAGDELLSKRVSVHYKPPTAPPQKAQENSQFIPPRSSCSYPAPPSKHESTCEPLYNLTRCKSEPRRAAVKLAAAGQQESCFWKNRPHAQVGVGAAGMGF